MYFHQPGIHLYEESLKYFYNFEIKFDILGQQAEHIRVHYSGFEFEEDYY